MADYQVSKLMWTGIVVALAASTFFVAKPQISSLTNGALSTVSKVVNPSNLDNGGANVTKIDSNDAKWVEKGDWGSNGKFVVDKDGSAVIYAMDASKPIIFHDMSDENEKLPKDTLTTLTFQDKVQGDTDSSMNRAFDDTFTNLKTINNLDTNVDTSKVTTMNSMFTSSQLTTIGDLGKWNTSKVTNMNSMFGDSQLTSVGDLSKWDTSKVTFMGGMFGNSQLTTVGDLSKWDTSNVTNMDWMFANSQLTSVGDLSNWNTSNVTNMGDMFYDSQLKTVGDLSQWNTSNVTNMSEMFSYSQLTSPSWYHGIINKIWKVKPDYHE